jgi:hypothetical protein
MIVSRFFQNFRACANESIVLRSLAGWAFCSETKPGSRRLFRAECSVEASAMGFYQRVRRS